MPLLGLSRKGKGPSHLFCFSMYTCTCTCTCICLCSCMHINTYMHIMHMHMNMYMYMHMYMYLHYVHMHVYVHIHTCIYGCKDFVEQDSEGGVCCAFTKLLHSSACNPATRLFSPTSLVLVAVRTLLRTSHPIKSGFSNAVALHRKPQKPSVDPHPNFINPCVSLCEAVKSSLQPGMSL